MRTIDATRQPTDVLLAGLVAAIRGGRSGLVANRPVYVASRRRGRRVGETWIDGRALDASLAELATSRADLLEIGVTFDYRDVTEAKMARALRDKERGIRGIVLSHGQDQRIFAPSRMIAANASFEHAIAKFCQEHAIERAAFFARGGHVVSFGARTALVPLDLRAPVEIYRSGRLVAEVTPAGAETMAREMAAWLVRSTAEDGRMPYKYWPSTGTYSSANNTIRQLMATVCLGRIARLWPDLGADKAFARNLAYNLAGFYRVHDGVGVIAYETSAKLGATALAALAILEHEGMDGPHAGELRALGAGVDALANPDGSFRTFHFPAERNDNQNFYPGEALVFWAALWSATKDGALLDRFMKSFRFYRQWHTGNRNPAFVPWHTQAYAAVYRATRDEELLAFLFEMNDWLLAMQQGDEVAYPDLVGRFYDPTRPEYGPPHASSTGVYLEGLADAFDLARACGDETRASAYASAICAGVRNLRQLQFKDDADLFYVSHRERVLGAVRTNAYDNTVRVDNVQHGLMAIMKLIETRHHETVLASPIERPGRSSSSARVSSER